MSTSECYLFLYGCFFFFLLKLSLTFACESSTASRLCSQIFKPLIIMYWQMLEQITATGQRITNECNMENNESENRSVCQHFAEGKQNY